MSSGSTMSKLVITLVYAKEYYLVGDFEKGDEFLLAVEKRAKKSERVKKLLVETRKNKRFYMYRDQSDGLVLKRTIKPKNHALND